MSLIVGNWKMNGDQASLAEAEAIAKGAPEGVSLGICPPATLIQPMAAMLAGLQTQVGAQTCHAAEAGAHTGDLGAPMLREAGAKFTLVGHSERRGDHGETNAKVQAQGTAALTAGLDIIVCVGESLEERQAGRALAVISEQVVQSLPGSATVQNACIAYEPIWAIGTGLTPSLTEIEDAHSAIRKVVVEKGLSDMVIIYGGSVKPGNAGDILAVPDVGGALVGGASLKATDFLAIAQAAPTAIG